MIGNTGRDVSIMVVNVGSSFPSNADNVLSLLRMIVTYQKK